jgi:hypothetical protein
MASLWAGITLSAMNHPSSELSSLAYLQPWQVAEILTSLHLQYCRTFDLPVDPDPIVDPDAMATNLRNTLMRQTNAILEYMYSKCGLIRLRAIITELVNRGAYGVLQERKWLWQEAKECSKECRDYANQCFREQFAATLSELPKLV